MRKSHVLLVVVTLVVLLGVGLWSLVSRKCNVPSLNRQAVVPIERKMEAKSSQQYMSPSVRNLDKLTTTQAHSNEVSTVRIQGNGRVQEPVRNVAGETNIVPLSGFVFDTSGRPKASVLVSLPLGHCRTDTDGKFYFENILPLLGGGKESGTITYMEPGKSWYIEKRIDDTLKNVSGSIDLGKINFPDCDNQTGVRGRVSGDATLYPRMLNMKSEDGSVFALVGVQRDGLISEQRGYPEGNYILSNTDAAGRPTPTNAIPQTCRIVLRKGEMTQVEFCVSRTSNN